MSVANVFFRAVYVNKTKTLEDVPIKWRSEVRTMINDAEYERQQTEDNSNAI